jgi:transcriptional regulator with XRE-family HTH domain
MASIVKISRWLDGLKGGDCLKQISLKAARINAGMTLEQVSEATGTTIATLSKWENNITFCTAMQLKRLCFLYGCTMNDIFVPDKLADS